MYLVPMSKTDRNTNIFGLTKKGQTPIQIYLGDKKGEQKYKYEYSAKNSAKKRVGNICIPPIMIYG